MENLHTENLPAENLPAETHSTAASTAKEQISPLDITSDCEAPIESFDLSLITDQEIERMHQQYAMSDECRSGKYRHLEQQARSWREFFLDLKPGIFFHKKAQGWLYEAKNRPDPKPLWGTLWFENEVCCLFADTNIGKSIYAVQIADSIARKGRRVLYIDFELSDKQFQLRYTDPQTGQLFDFSNNLLRAEMQQTMMPDSMEEMVRQIEAVALRSGCRILIIDNITWICNRTESGDAAGELMQLLIQMKRRWGMSILCLAHTPKRAACSPLTQNSLAGSKRLANFMDSIFAIGKDFTNTPHGRYIKQIKVRNAENLYDENNVIRTEIAKIGSLLAFSDLGYGCEQQLLKAAHTDETDETDSYDLELRNARIIELRQQGMTQAQIAKEAGCSVGLVNKVLRNSTIDQ